MQSFHQHRRAVICCFSKKSVIGMTLKGFEISNVGLAVPCKPVILLLLCRVCTQKIFASPIND